MRFCTPVDIAPNAFEIKHSNHIVVMGSCFSEHIGKRLVDAYFPCLVNPYGILFNPASIAQSLQEIIQKKEYCASDLVLYNGLYHSMNHHGCFSCSHEEETLRQINESIHKAHEHLLKTDYLFITFGTAWIYEMDGKVVANCHKMPAQHFDRRRMEVDEICEIYASLIAQLRHIRPEIQIVFTVSPVRHTKDGLHENQLSKSTLLLAVDKICRQTNGCYYFPAYEIVLDELRDYRFFADDMAHPSELTVAYVWERFLDTYCSAPTRQLIDEAFRLQQRLEHRMLHPNSEEAKRFTQETQNKLADFLVKIGRTK